MDNKNELIIIISKVTEPEKDFFENWNLDPPLDPPYAVYINRNGFRCDVEKAELVLISGDKSELIERVIKVSQASGKFVSAFLLVHTGAGDEVVNLLKRERVPADLESDSKVMFERSFPLRTGRQPYRFILNELAIKANQDDLNFPRALTFLRQALNYAAERYQKGVQAAEDRSKAAREYLNNPMYRKDAGMPEPEPQSPWKNPVAAIIHDVIGRFDALHIDLQTAIEDADYWNTEKTRYQNRIQKLIKLIDDLISSDVSHRDLRSLQTIVKTISTNSLLTDEDRILLQKTASQLKRLVSPEANLKVFQLLMDINSGRKEVVISEDVETLGLWLYAIRQELYILDTLYKNLRNK